MWASIQSKWELIADNTRCQVISAGINKGYSYPYRLLKESELRPSVRDRALELTVDSGYNNDDVSNEDVIEKAVDYNVDYIIPKDYPGRPDETVEMMKQFFDVYSPNQNHPKPYVVVQPPLADTFERHADFYSQFGRFALGGLRDLKPRQQANEIYGFWSAISAYDGIEESAVDIHGFGLGLSPELVLLIRTYPHVLDSIDVSTPERAISNNEIPDGLWDRIPIDLPRGDSRRDLQARYCEATLYMMNYLLGTEVRQNDLYERMGLFDSPQDLKAEVADD